MSYRGGLYEAIKSLQPYAEFGIYNNDYSTLEWYDDPSVVPIPTKEEAEAEDARLRAKYESNEYQRLRAEEYPPIGDQLDALFHAGLFPPEMAALLQAVKDKHPKGGAQ
jgi:hypothetical protein